MTEAHPPPFCKTLPYTATDVEAQLRNEGRLEGDRFRPDYWFLDPRVDRWFEYLNSVLRPCVGQSDSVMSYLKWARFELDVLERFFGRPEGLTDHRRAVTALTGHYNDIFCRIFEDSAPLFDAEVPPDAAAFYSLWSAANEQREWIESTLLQCRDDFFAQTGIPGDVVAIMRPARSPRVLAAVG